MNINISKEEFEETIKVARSPKSHVYDALRASFPLATEKLAVEVLGEKGRQAVSTNGTIARLTKEYVCLDVFIREMRGLDVVLTSTGFGVVSTNDTAPASKQRVDAVEGELRVKRLQTKDRLLQELFKVEGWCDCPQRRVQVPTLFMYSLLSDLAGIARPKEEDWSAAQAPLLEADIFLREHISDEYMDELLQQWCSDSLTDENHVILFKLRKFMGMKISGNHAGAMTVYRDVINTMERDLEHYKTYANSEAYELNHLKPYENTAEKTAFHWVG